MTMYQELARYVEVEKNILGVLKLLSIFKDHFVYFLFLTFQLALFMLLPLLPSSCAQFLLFQQGSSTTKGTYHIPLLTSLGSSNNS